MKKILIFAYIAISTNTLQLANLHQLDKQNLKDFFSIPIFTIIHGYRNILSKGVRSSCPMYPSCSTYGLHAVKAKGPIFGLFSIVDRLNRCGHDTYIYPLIKRNNRLFFYDPIKE